MLSFKLSWRERREQTKLVPLPERKKRGFTRLARNRRKAVKKLSLVREGQASKWQARVTRQLKITPKYFLVFQPLTMKKGPKTSTPFFRTGTDHQRSENGMTRVGLFWDLRFARGSCNK